MNIDLLKAVERLGVVGLFAMFLYLGYDFATEFGRGVRKDLKEGWILTESNRTDAMTRLANAIEDLRRAPLEVDVECECACDGNLYRRQYAQPIMQRNPPHP